MAEVTDRHRAMLENFRNEFKRAKANPDKYPITPSYLRLEIPLTATSYNTIQWDVLANETTYSGAVGATERRLGTTDAFKAESIALYIAKVVVAAAPVISPTERSGMLLDSFVNPLTYLTTEAALLQGIYNGNLRLKIGAITYFEAIDCMRFLRVGVSQRAVGSSAASNAPIPRNQWDAMQWGMMPLTPQFTMLGTVSNSFTLNLPTSLDLRSAAGGVNMAVLYIRGLHALNGGNVLKPSA